MAGTRNPDTAFLVVLRTLADELQEDYRTVQNLSLKEEHPDYWRGKRDGIGKAIERTEAFLRRAAQ